MDNVQNCDSYKLKQQVDSKTQGFASPPPRFMPRLFFTLKIEAACFFETSMDFFLTGRCYIQENKTVHSHCSENMNSELSVLVYDKYKIKICNNHLFKSPPLHLNIV
jgi:hypothetical protein